MKWIRIVGKDKLPEENKPVLVWMRYADEKEFEFTETQLVEMEHTHPSDYIEPNSKRHWLMGSANNYVITHWMDIIPPK